jgi:hypothetical protein
MFGRRTLGASVTPPDGGFMETTASRLLRLYLWFIAIFHLFVGLAVNFSESFTRMIAAGYGATVDWTPQFVYILRPLGAFMIILGILAAVAARQPARYPAVIIGFVILFGIRALHRLFYYDVLASAFGISKSRSMLNMAVFAVQAVVLLLLWRASRDSEVSAAAVPA